MPGQARAPGVSRGATGSPRRDAPEQALEAWERAAALDPHNATYRANVRALRGRLG